MIRPLPLRLQPYDGESWPGYLGRSASAHAVTVPALLERLDPSWVRRLRFPHALRNTGIAATDATLMLLAHYFNLTTTEVRDMHLLRYDGTALHFSADDRIAFDPIDPDAEKLPRSVGTLGWLPDQRKLRTCDRCLRDNPDRMLLTWRLPWHVVCEEHTKFITVGTTTESGTPAVSEEFLGAQRFVLSLAEGETDVPDKATLQVFRELSALVIGLLRTRSHANALSRSRPEHLLDTLPAAVTSVRTPPEAGPGDAYREVLGSTVGRDVFKRSMGQTLTAASAEILEHPPALEGASGQPLMPQRLLTAPRHVRLPATSHMPGLTAFPQLLPRHLFNGDISDLCYPLPIHRGRLAAGVCCILAAKGCTVDQAAMPPRGGSGHLVGQLWRRLETHGREDVFWLAIGAAAQALIQEYIDYGYRREAMRLPHVIDAVHRAAPGLHRGNIKVWLIDQWACCSTLRPRKSVLDGITDELTVTLGATLTAAANRAVRICA